MAVKIKFDNTNNAIAPTFILATRSGDRIGYIPAREIRIIDNLNSYFELNFQVDKFTDNIQTPLWDQIQDFRLVYCPEFDVWFEIYVSIGDEDGTYKIVTAVSLCEAELSQINLYDIEINTENDIARDDYAVTVLFDELDPNASLLNRVLAKAPHYTILHVDASIASIQRSFSFNDICLYDALQQIAEEINCIFVFDSGMTNDGKISRSISVYDLESHCNECGERGSFLRTCSECGSQDISTGYGQDTSIFISSDNLADGITYKANTDSVKNCFKLEAGDDLMTATIANCNPNGSSYIWYISDATRADMSDELRNALTEYDAIYAHYEKEKQFEINADVLDAYNHIIKKYTAFNMDLSPISSPVVGHANLMRLYYDTVDLYLLLHDSMMPSMELEDTTAAEQAISLASSLSFPVAVTDLSICSESTATSAVLAIAKTLVDPRYRVKAISSGYSNGVWSGSFDISNYADETEMASTGSMSVNMTDDYATYVQQRMDKITKDTDENNSTDISSLFALSLDNFKSAIRQYSLVRLQAFADSCQSCLDIMIEQGIANSETWADSGNDLYTTMYVPYYQKLTALQEEIVIREEELAVIAGLYDDDGSLISEGMQTVLLSATDLVHEALNFEKSLGSELWKELIAYRREDTYRNDNYISDGLSNSEVISLATEFLATARKEIYKSATLQHSITANLKNLLVMKEFQPIVKFFSVGNWIRIAVDGTVYRLRIISYEIDYNELDNISITFSDVTKVANGMSDSASILQQAASMASSYDSIARQTTQAKKTQTVVSGWVTDGLALTKMKIIDNAKDQNITWDEHGLLCRQYLPITDSYDKKQLKIINRGLYLTDDNWLTSKAGIGDFTFYNPETGNMEEAYGVIADVLVGNLILSEKVGIYNTDNSIILDKNGIVITTNGENVTGDQKVFTIRKKNADANGIETIENILYADNSGNLHFKGTLHGANGDFTGALTATSLTIKSGNTSVDIDTYVGEHDSVTGAQQTATNAQNTANAANTAAANAQSTANAANTNASNALNTANSASSTASAAQTLANNIYNGVKGIYFTNSSVGSVQISSTVGLKVIGTDNTYFQVKNNAMGFFRADNTAMLYYEDGNMVLSGVIAAAGSYIGGTDGWVIGTDCIYNGGASALGADGGIYLGKDGISISSAIVMKPDGTFIIRNDNASSSDSNYVLRVSPETNADGDIIYTMYLSNVTFDEGFVLPVKHGGTGGTTKSAIEAFGIYRVTSESDLSSLPDVNNGDIGILYSDGEDGSTIVGTYTTTPTSTPGYLSIATYSDTGHRYTSYFGISTSTVAYWNTDGLSGDQSVSNSYARVGVGSTTAGSCGLFVPLNVVVENSTLPITTFKINFTFNMRPAGCSRDLVASWTRGIIVAVYKPGSNGSYTLIARSTYNYPSSWQTTSNTDRAASITLTSSIGLTTGEYYVVFYNGGTRSLTWIKAATVCIPSTSTGAAAGLYLRTGGMWRALTSVS